jgi:hypothetical protein
MVGSDGRSRQERCTYVNCQGYNQGFFQGRNLLMVQNIFFDPLMVSIFKYVKGE